MNIRHDPTAERFVAEERGQRLGILEYEVLEDGALDYRHTFVLEEHRGRGIATRLARAALDHAVDRGLPVVPSCPFVATLMERDPGYRALRAERSEGREEQEELRRLQYAVAPVGL